MSRGSSNILPKSGYMQSVQWDVPVIVRKNPLSKRMKMTEVVWRKRMMPGPVFHLAKSVPGLVKTENGKYQAPVRLFVHHARSNEQRADLSGSLF